MITARGGAATPKVSKVMFCAKFPGSGRVIQALALVLKTLPGLHPCFRRLMLIKRCL